MHSYTFTIILGYHGELKYATISWSDIETKLWNKWETETAEIAQETSCDISYLKFIS